MIEYQTIIVKDGQSLNRIALQYYGSSDIAILNMLVTDNSDVLQNGITSRPAAGTNLYIRKNYENANSIVLDELQGIGINQHLSADDPLSGETITNTVTIEPGTEQTIVIGSIYTCRAIFINCWWQENGNWFCGTSRVLHDNNTADYSFGYDSFNDYVSDMEFNVALNNDNITMTITTLCAHTVTFRYEIVTPFSIN